MALPLAALIPAVGGLLSSAIDLFSGDKKLEAELLLKELDNAQAQLTAQAETNKIEAAHSSIFVAGWRPFIGWMCGISVAYEFFLRPVCSWAAGIWLPEIPQLPSNSSVLLELVFAMLGIGGLRTFEKIKGVAR